MLLINDNMWKKLQHIVIGWYYYLTGKDYELSNKRLDICNSCENKLQLSKKYAICDNCGCFLKAKVLVKDEKCPISK